jgi:hypothetical protein
VKALRILPCTHNLMAAGRRLLVFCGCFAAWMASAVLLPAAVDAGSTTAIEHFTYDEITGSQQIQITYRIEKGDPVLIQVKRADELFFNRCEPTGNTIEWHFRGRTSEVSVQRQGQSLIVGGHRQGKPFQKTYPIDASPWLQPLSYALQPHLWPNKRTIRFWLIRSDTFEPVKLKAVRSETEEILLDGKRFPSCRVDVSPSGPLSFIWHGRYWFRKSDGVFLRYAGGSLLSGAGDTVISLRMDADLPDSPLGQEE